MEIYRKREFELRVRGLTTTIGLFLGQGEGKSQPQTRLISSVQLGNLVTAERDRD